MTSGRLHCCVGKVILCFQEIKGCLLILIFCLPGGFPLLTLHFNCCIVLKQDGERQLFRTYCEQKGSEILFLRRVIKIRVSITLRSRVKITCTSIFIFIFIIRKKYFFSWKEGAEKGTVLAKYCTFEHHSFPSQ